MSLSTLATIMAFAMGDCGLPPEPYKRLDTSLPPVDEEKREIRRLLKKDRVKRSTKKRGF